MCATSSANISGALWAGTDGDGIYRIAGGRTTRWTYRDGLTNTSSAPSYRTATENMWIATDAGLITWLEISRIRELPAFNQRMASPIRHPLPA